MTDDEIKVLLASTPRSTSLPHPVATVAILRRDVEEAGLDHRVVSSWIGAHSGETRIAPAMKAADQPAGDGMPRWEGPFQYYVIPLSALAGAGR